MHRSPLCPRSPDAPAHLTKYACGLLTGIFWGGNLISAAVVSEAPQPGDAVPPQILAWQQEAEGGSAQAAVELGKAYAEGRGVRPDLSEAEKWLRQALQKREITAYHPLGLLLLQTSSQGSDVERAAEGLEILRAAAEVDPACSVALGQFRAQGQFIKQDFAEAEKRFRAAADKGSADGWFWLGWLHSGEAGFPDQGDPQQAVGFLEKAFEDGSVEAGRLLVKMLREGTRIPKDEEKAFQVVAEAARRGNSEALFFLAELYEEGAGVEKSPEKAVENYLAAAEKGNAKAQNKLGLLYSAGQAGLANDPKSAREWFERAAQAGFAPAHLNLALILANGAEPGSPESREAAQHLVAAASTGLADAQDRLGSWYRDGKNVPRDLVAAAGWFRPAANAGHLSAKINLAQILEANIRNAEDLRTALGLYADAAAAGHPVAHYHLARLLVSGLTGRIDLVQAHAHLAVAARAGFPPAAGSLAGIEERLTEEQRAASTKLQESLQSLQWTAAAPVGASAEEEASAPATNEPVAKEKPAEQ